LSSKLMLDLAWKSNALLTVESFGAAAALDLGDSTHVSSALGVGFQNEQEAFLFNIRELLLVQEESAVSKVGTRHVRRHWKVGNERVFVGGNTGDNLLPHVVARKQLQLETQSGMVLRVAPLNDEEGTANCGVSVNNLRFLELDPFLLGLLLGHVERRLVSNGNRIKRKGRNIIFVIVLAVRIL